MDKIISTNRGRREKRGNETTLSTLKGVCFRGNKIHIVVRLMVLSFVALNQFACADKLSFEVQRQQGTPSLSNNTRCNHGNAQIL